MSWHQRSKIAWYSLHGMAVIETRLVSGGRHIKNQEKYNRRFLEEAAKFSKNRARKVTHITISYHKARQIIEGKWGINLFYRQRSVCARHQPAFTKSSEPEQWKREQHEQ
jgi:hypothetical protein